MSYRRCIRPTLGYVEHLHPSMSNAMFPKVKKQSTLLEIRQVRMNRVVNRSIRATQLTEVDLNKIAALIYSARWNGLGTSLRIPIPELESIKLKHGADLKECTYQVLLRWKEMYPKITLQKLYKALRDEGLNKQVQDVKKYIKSVKRLNRIKKDESNPANQATSQPGRSSTCLATSKPISENEVQHASDPTDENKPTGHPEMQPTSEPTGQPEINKNPLNKMASSSKCYKSETNLKDFVEDVRKYAYLYDKSKPEFKDTVLKKTAWTAIGTKFKMSGDEASQKWNVQRKRYNKDKRKIKETSYIGSGVGDVYKPTWGLFKIIDSMLGGGVAESNCTPPNMEQRCDVDDNLNLGNDMELNDVVPILGTVAEDLIGTVNEDTYWIDKEISNDDSTCPNPANMPTAILKAQKGLKVMPSTSERMDPAFNASVKSSSAMEENVKRKTDVEPTVKSASAEEIKVQRFCAFLESRLNLMTKIDKLETMRKIEQIAYEVEVSDKYFA